MFLLSVLNLFGGIHHLYHTLTLLVTFHVVFEILDTVLNLLEILNETRGLNLNRAKASLLVILT